MTSLRHRYSWVRGRHTKRRLYPTRNEQLLRDIVSEMGFDAEYEVEYEYPEAREYKGVCLWYDIRIEYMGKTVIIDLKQVYPSAWGGARSRKRNERVHNEKLAYVANNNIPFIEIKPGPKVAMRVQLEMALLRMRLDFK